MRAGLHDTGQRVLDDEDASTSCKSKLTTASSTTGPSSTDGRGLRFVLAVSRINNDLERIGESGLNIAQGHCAFSAIRA